jgi:hypothetical protein
MDWGMIRAGIEGLRDGMIIGAILKYMGVI